MRRLLDALVLFALCGCVTMRGPITGKPYACTNVSDGDPHWGYYEEVRQLYLQTHPELAPEVVAAIRECRVIPGMTKDDVRAAWGCIQGQSYVETWQGDGDLWVFPRQWTMEHVLFDRNGRVVSSGSGATPQRRGAVSDGLRS